MVESGLYTLFPSFLYLLPKLRSRSAGPRMTSTSTSRSNVPSTNQKVSIPLTSLPRSSTFSSSRLPPLASNTTDSLVNTPVSQWPIADRSNRSMDDPIETSSLTCGAGGGTRRHFKRRVAIQHPFETSSRGRTKSTSASVKQTTPALHQSVANILLSSPSQLKKSVNNDNGNSNSVIVAKQHNGSDSDQHSHRSRSTSMVAATLTSTSLTTCASQITTTTSPLSPSVRKMAKPPAGCLGPIAVRSRSSHQLTNETDDHDELNDGQTTGRCSPKTDDGRLMAERQSDIEWWNGDESTAELSAAKFLRSPVSVLAPCKVIEARGLRANSDQECNSCVKISFLPEKNSWKSVFETELFRNSTTPKFDSTFQFDLAKLKGCRRILVTAHIKHPQAVSEDGEFLGGMSFGMSSLKNRDEVTGWYYLLNASLARKKHLKANTEVVNTTSNGQTLSSTNDKPVSQANGTGAADSSTLTNNQTADICQNQPITSTKQHQSTDQSANGERPSRIDHRSGQGHWPDWGVLTNDNNSIAVDSVDSLVGCNYYPRPYLPPMRPTNQCLPLSNWFGSQSVPVTIAHVPKTNQALNNMYLQHFIMTRGPKGFGFTLAGSCPVFVSHVELNSPAMQSGVRSGDYIVAVDQVNVSRSTTNSVVRMFKMAQRPIQLTVCRPIDQPLMDPNFLSNHHQQPVQRHTAARSLVSSLFHTKSPSSCFSPLKKSASNGCIMMTASTSSAASSSVAMSSQHPLPPQNPSVNTIRRPQPSSAMLSQSRGRRDRYSSPVTSDHLGWQTAGSVVNGNVVGGGGPDQLMNNLLPASIALSSPNSNLRYSSTNQQPPIHQHPMTSTQRNSLASMTALTDDRPILMTPLTHRVDRFHLIDPFNAQQAIPVEVVLTTSPNWTLLITSYQYQQQQVPTLIHEPILIDRISYLGLTPELADRLIVQYTDDYNSQQQVHLQGPRSSEWLGLLQSCFQQQHPPQQPSHQQCRHQSGPRSSIVSTANNNNAKPDVGCWPTNR